MMMTQRPRALPGAALLLALQVPLLEAKTEATDKTDSLVAATQQRLQNNQKAQKQVDNVVSQTQQLEQAYLQELKVKESLDIYNLMLQKQLDTQERQIGQLQHSIANASLIERQIMPLLVRMTGALQGLVQADLPFLKQEREQRIEELNALLERPDLTLAEKSRRVFEAYQIEMEYGYTIENYKDEIQLGENTVAADVLRIGRIALVFQDINGEQFGHWQPQTRQWAVLQESQYRRHINKGMRIAKEEIAPELMTIPFNQAQETLK